MKPVKPSLGRPQIIVLSVLLCALALILAVRYIVAPELVRARAENATLRGELKTARARLYTEKTRTTVAEREAEVVRKANGLLRGSERRQQEEIARLKGDLALYRRLGGASGSQAALAIHHVELQRTSAPRVYRLVVTLTQNLRWAAVISGRVRLGIDGIAGGAARHLDGETLFPKAAQPLKFRFKYFQQLERLLTLPEGFEPATLDIRLESHGLKHTVEQTVAWQDLFNPPAGY